MADTDDDGEHDELERFSGMTDSDEDSEDELVSGSVPHGYGGDGGEELTYEQAVGVDYSGNFQVECPECSAILYFESRSVERVTCGGCGTEWAIGTPTVDLDRE